MIALPILNVAAIRALEQQAAGQPLMEMAGAAAAAQIRVLSPRTIDPVVVFAGPGNNGGDGFVVARLLHQWGYRVSVVTVSEVDRLPPDAREAYRRWIDAGGSTLADAPSLQDAGLVVDALFGIGIGPGRPPAGVYAEWIAAINRADCPVLALDIPSGLDADTGLSAGPVVQATHTATFIALKPGLLTGDGLDSAGDVTLHDLGIDASSAPDAGRLIDWPLARQWVHKRRRNTHKGSYGTLGIVGGATGMVGAPLLAGRAALMSGAGKVHLGFVAEVPPAIDFCQPELMLRAADEVLRGDSTVLLVGPGLGQSRRSADYLARALHKSVPLVLDADALNLLAQESALANRLAHREQPALLTPHPAEAARLLQTSTAIVQSDRVAAAKRLAERFHSLVALKGAGTVCALPDGDWTINATGNAGLASVGTGDVLAGIIAALLAQGYAAERALRLGVCVHGRAADALVDNGIGPIGMVATELMPEVRRLLNE